MGTSRASSRSVPAGMPLPVEAAAVWQRHLANKEAERPRRAQEKALGERVPISLGCKSSFLRIAHTGAVVNALASTADPDNSAEVAWVRCASDRHACTEGSIWREAYQGGFRCVVPNSRTQARHDPDSVNCDSDSCSPQTSRRPTRPGQAQSLSGERPCHQAYSGCGVQASAVMATD
ncbi:hypothetical protein [Nonomuraea sp. NPDC003201]